MSLFDALMGFGGMDEDPFFGGSMRHLNSMMNNHMNMMNSFFPLSPPGITDGASPMGPMVPFGGPMMRGLSGFGMGLMPMGFPHMRMMLDEMPNAGHSYSHSTVMTMSNGPDGRPQVYQASSSMRQGPGGVKETRKSVADSRTGVKKMQIGHHIGERAHLIEREKNFRSGEAEERQEFINLDEDEADDFNQEWQSKAYGRAGPAAIGSSERRRQHQPQLALPSSSSRSSEKKKRPHDCELENQSTRRKNQRRGQPSEPIPIVEEPDSDSEHPAPHYRANNTIIVEELE